MRLSRKGEYACLALIELSRNYEKGLVKIEDISKKEKIPKKYLEQILLSLKKAGYLKSKRGAEGGYRLSKAPNKISLAEIIRLMDGALAPVDSVSTYFYEAGPIEENKKLIVVFKDIRNYAAKKLEKTTFADVI